MVQHLAPVWRLQDIISKCDPPERTNNLVIPGDCTSWSAASQDGELCVHTKSDAHLSTIWGMPEYTRFKLSAMMYSAILPSPIILPHKGTHISCAVCEFHEKHPILQLVNTASSGCIRECSANLLWKS